MTDLVAIETQALVVIDQGGTTVQTEVVQVQVVSAGEQGPQGPQGQDGSAAQIVHDQAIPSALWHILHNQGKWPTVTVYDNLGNQVIADVQHTDLTQLYIAFAVPTIGKAILI